MIFSLHLFSIYLVLVLTSMPLDDFMRSTGKIWVVVISLVIIFIGIVFFLYKLENRISKIEKEIKDE
nr:CcmD family protein [Saprospiraceae bacterium]